jgi:hypothetical protein
MMMAAKLRTTEQLERAEYLVRDIVFCGSFQSTWSGY